MTEVIRVPRRPAREDHAADKFDEPDSESPPATEVIRVVSRRAVTDAVAVQPVAPDPEQPQHKEVIRVGAAARQRPAGNLSPTDADTPQATEAKRGAGDSAIGEVAARNPDPQLQEVAAIAAVFSDSLKALDLVAAEQARWVLGIAESLVAAVRSAELAGSRTVPVDSPSDQDEVEALVTALKRTADTQMKALTTAQARLAEMAARGKSDADMSPRRVSSGAPGISVEAAVTNMVSNLNLAQQNAVANQQSMNSIAQAAISAGVSLLYSLSAHPLTGSKED